jgi:transketolase
MVSKALEAAGQLEKEGVSAKVVNVPSIKPIDSAQVAEVANSVKAVVTAEEHSVLGGLGGLICEIVSGLAPKKVVRVGIQDTFGSSAQDYDTLLNAYGLTAQAIVDAAKKSLK